VSLAVAAPDPFDGLYPVVTLWCRRLARRGVDPESAAQDVLYVLARRRHELRDGAPLQAWAWGITIRTLAAESRKAWLRRWIPGPVPDAGFQDDPSRAIERRELAEQVRAILDDLTDDQRQILVLCDVEERSRADIAVLLGVPEGTVKSRLRLAREAFRRVARRRGLDVPEGDHA
jgi:RNA polymerase sigma-70 factor (ECF subfamily)